MNAAKKDPPYMATKRTDPDYEQVSGYIHKDLALKFKILCTTQRRTQSELLAEALTLYMETRAVANAEPDIETKTKKPPASKGKRV